MKHAEVDLHSMSIAELWKLREDVLARLTTQLVEKRNVLDQRLRRLAPLTEIGRAA